MKNTNYALSIIFVVVICSYSSLFPHYLAAQSSDSTRVDSLNEKSRESILNPSISQFTTAVRQIFTMKSNLVFLGAGTAFSLIAHPYDNDISRDLKEDDFTEFEVEVPNKIGSFFVVAGVTLSTHLLGRALKRPSLANTGLYMFEAVMATQLVTFLVKKSVQRTRPDNSNNLSFPSGHTSAMTAIAAVLQRRNGWKVGIPAYLLASYVAVTRIKTQKHFASDVLAGATLGTIIGRSFVPLNTNGKSFALVPNIGKDGFRVNAQLIF